MREKLLEAGIKDADYIGDGVYVANDGYQIWLYVHEEGMIETFKRIALEPGVMTKLIHYNKLFMDALSRGEEIFPHLNVIKED